LDVKVAQSEEDTFVLIEVALHCDEESMKLGEQG
jgi:hypothetical protein